MYFRTLATLLILIVAKVSFATGEFPAEPDSLLTPGAVCTTPTRFVYESNMPYCDRKVDTKLKWQIIHKYMEKYSFVVDQSNRQDYKVDHYIPLCMGGSNSVENLWPQHKSLFLVTDKAEEALCKQLAANEITQEDAIKKIKKAKARGINLPALIIEEKDITLVE